MAARNQVLGLLQTAKQLEAEAELIMKKGLQNLQRSGQRCLVYSQRQMGASFECQQVVCEQESHHAVDSFTILATECSM